MTRIFLAADLKCLPILFALIQSSHVHALEIISRIISSACNAGPRVRSLGREDPLEKELATHSSILAWRIPWAERPGRLQSMGLQRVGHDCLSHTISSIPPLS